MFAQRRALATVTRLSLVIVSSFSERIFLRNISLTVFETYGYMRQSRCRLLVLWFVVLCFVGLRRGDRENFVL